MRIRLLVCLLLMLAVLVGVPSQSVLTPILRTCSDGKIAYIAQQGDAIEGSTSAIMASAWASLFAQNPMLDGREVTDHGTTARLELSAHEQVCGIEKLGFTVVSPSRPASEAAESPAPVASKKFIQWLAVICFSAALVGAFIAGAALDRKSREIRTLKAEAKSLREQQERRAAESETKPEPKPVLQPKRYGLKDWQRRVEQMKISGKMPTRASEIMYFSHLMDLGFEITVFEELQRQHDMKNRAWEDVQLTLIGLDEDRREMLRRHREEKAAMTETRRACEAHANRLQEEGRLLKNDIDMLWPRHRPSDDVQASPTTSTEVLEDSTRELATLVEDVFHREEETDKQPPIDA